MEKEAFTSAQVSFTLTKVKASLTQVSVTFINIKAYLRKKGFNSAKEKAYFIKEETCFVRIEKCFNKYAAYNRRKARKSVLNEDWNNKAYTLTGADGKSYKSEKKGMFDEHRKDKIHGTLDCKGAARWIAKGHYVKQRVFFADEQTGIAAGYRTCFGCLRWKYKVWQGNK